MDGNDRLLLAPFPTGQELEERISSLFNGRAV